MKQAHQSDEQRAPVTPTLITAYRATHYCVTGVAEAFVLRIDQHSPDLAGCHDQYRVSTSAFLTAYNPLSQPTPEAANEAAQQRLVLRLQACGYQYLEGLGLDPSGDWPAEPSLLVLGISLDEARSIGTEFAQNGFVWAAADAVPRLVLLR
jgi:hypothetical protein